MCISNNENNDLHLHLTKPNAFGSRLYTREIDKPTESVSGTERQKPPPHVVSRIRFGIELTLSSVPCKPLATGLKTLSNPPLNEALQSWRRSYDETDIDWILTGRGTVHTAPLSRTQRPDRLAGCSALVYICIVDCSSRFYWYTAQHLVHTSTTIAAKNGRIWHCKSQDEEVCYGHKHGVTVVHFTFLVRYRSLKFCLPAYHPDFVRR